MIIALLFLILFALLFPKALKFLLALALICSIAALSEAHAEKSISFRAAENTITDSAADAIMDMENYANKCVRSYLLSMSKRISRKQ